MEALGIAICGRTFYMALVSGEPTKPERLLLPTEQIPLGCGLDEKGEYLLEAKRRLEELIRQVKPDVVGLKMSEKDTYDARVGENLWIKLQSIVEVICAEANISTVLLKTRDIARRLEMAEKGDDAIVEKIGEIFSELSGETDVCKLYAVAAAVSLLGG